MEHHPKRPHLAVHNLALLHPRKGWEGGGVRGKGERNEGKGVRGREERKGKGGRWGVRTTGK